MSEIIQENKPLVGITIGDLNGIGGEIIIKALADPRILNYCTPVIYASVAAVNFHKKGTDSKAFTFYSVDTIDAVQPGKVNVVVCWDEQIRMEPGTPDPSLGRFAFMSLSRATDDVLAGKLDAIVTAPIDKHSMQSEEFAFPGHTEYLAERSAAKALMLMIGEDIRVGVATGHIMLSEVSEHITTDGLLDKLRIMNLSLKRDFAVRKPKIAVLGLNPHAGENGLLGHEEAEIITPAIERARERGALVFGPFPADGFFALHQYREFDAVLAMYHDQGLVPFKMLNFAKGVNYTAGLPIVRTSPDHGTAYTIAAKNIADETSLREAIFRALEILRNRAMHVEINEDPLQSKTVRERERDA